MLRRPNCRHQQKRAWSIELSRSAASRRNDYGRARSLGTVASAEERQTQCRLRPFIVDDEKNPAFSTTVSLLVAVLGSMDFIEHAARSSIALMELHIGRLG